MSGLRKLRKRSSRSRLASEYGQMIRRLYVNNFKCFVNFTLKLGREQVIVGDNGSEKSTLFELLWLLQKFVIDGARAASAATS